MNVGLWYSLLLIALNVNFNSFKSCARQVAFILIFVSIFFDSLLGKDSLKFVIDMKNNYTNQSFYYISRKNLFSVSSIVKSDNFYKLYDISFQNYSTIYDFYKKNSIKSFHRFFKVRNFHCDPTKTTVGSGRIRTSEDIKSPNKKSNFFDFFNIARCKKEQDCDYGYYYKKNDCLPDPGESLLTNHLSKLGLNRYIVYDNLQSH